MPAEKKCAIGPLRKVSGQLRFAVFPKVGVSSAVERDGGRSVAANTTNRTEQINFGNPAVTNPAAEKALLLGFNKRTRINDKGALAGIWKDCFSQRMQMKQFIHLVFSLAVALTTGSAFAVNNYTETFNADASGWLNGASGVPTYFSNGGVGDSGYISYTTSFTSAATGSFGAPPTQLMFRANDAANASGDAFVGSWIDGGVITLSLTVRHNYTSTLNFYARLAASTPPGAGASLFYDTAFAVAPNTWTTINIPIINDPAVFVSYGSGTFASVFAAIQNMQFGFYVPVSTTFTDFTMDIDNVTLTVPEPSSALLVALGGLGALMLKRRRQSGSSRKV